MPRTPGLGFTDTGTPAEGYRACSSLMTMHNNVSALKLCFPTEKSDLLSKAHAESGTFNFPFLGNCERSNSGSGVWNESEPTWPCSMFLKCPWSSSSSRPCALPGAFNHKSGDVHRFVLVAAASFRDARGMLQEASESSISPLPVAVCDTAWTASWPSRQMWLDLGKKITDIWHQRGIKLWSAASRSLSVIWCSLF